MFHHSLVADFVAVSSSWVLFWAVVIILFLLVMIAAMALRGFWRLALLFGSVAVVITGQVVIFHDLRTVPTPVAIPADEVTVKAMVMESERYRDERQRIIIRILDEDPLAEPFGEGRARLIISSGEPPLLPGDIVVM